MSILSWLQDWFASQCDGDWEHQYSIKIETLDNPGWSIEIDLSNTIYANVFIDKILIETDDNDWLSYSIANSKFKGFGDTSKLETLIEKFREIIEHTSIGSPGSRKHGFN